MSLRKAAEMALKVLEADEAYIMCVGGSGDHQREAAKALRQALDYPTPEQIAFAQQIRPKGKSRIGQALAQQEPDEFCTATTEELMKALGCSDKKAKEIHNKVEALAQPEYQSTAGKSKLEKVPAKGTLLAQPEQDPAAWLSIDCIGERYLFFSKPTDNDQIQPLYTAPPKREWVGLTAHDKAVLIDQMWNQAESFEQFMDSIDKFLEEKNT